MLINNKRFFETDVIEYLHIGQKKNRVRFFIRPPTEGKRMKKILDDAQS